MTYWNGNIIGKRISVAPGAVSGIFNLQSHTPYINDAKWPRAFIFTLGGLAGKFFAGDFRNVIGAGNIGSIPLTTTDDAPNNFPSGTKGVPLGYDAGVNIWDEIDFGTNLSNNYGFIAIGYFKAPATGTFQFDTTSDDGSGVWIGANALEGGTRNTSNAVVNNGMGTGHASQTRSGSISLTQDVFYPIRVVFEEGGGGDNMRFRWRLSGGTFSTDLSQYYYHATVNNVITGDFF